MPVGILTHWHSTYEGGKRQKKLDKSLDLFQAVVKTEWIISFKFLHLTIVVPSIVRPARDFSADSGTMHFL